MAYNLQPLITILEGILDPDQPRWIVDQNNPQLQSLLHKATSLQHLLDKSSLTKFDSRIREVAHQAEDIIESHVVDHILSGSNCVRFTLSTPDLQQVARELDSVMEQAEKLMEMEDKKMPRELDFAMEQLKLVDKNMPSSSSSSSKSVVVGIDADLMQLKERLIGQQKKKLVIVPIVGMGGIGKTTLARKLYEDPLIVDHFDYRAWTTVSQDYNMWQIIKSLLRCITGQEYNQRNDELQDVLYKSLYGRKYLIVLDDIWSTKFWDEMRMYFPDNNNRSRIVITTRESDVAKYADSLSLHHQVQLLSKSQSWNLLYQLVFGDEDCPPDLQEIGEKIVGGCSGLPLAISVIGGLLFKMERSEEVWKNIGDNVMAAIAESNEQCYSILSLSYNHLPNHLKPCFLYMGAFPEDYEIKGSILVCFWVAEGFVKSNGEKSLEEEAEDWLKSLVERNLFMVRRYKKNGKPKSYTMHDMLRDLCIRKCAEEKFLYVRNSSNATFSNPHRVSLDISNGMDGANGSTVSMSLTRSLIFICFDPETGRFSFGIFAALMVLILLGILDNSDGWPTEMLEYVNLHFFGVNWDSNIPNGVLRLLRVLHLLHFGYPEFPAKIFEFVNLRFLGIKCDSDIPKGISRLWNLQTLIAPHSKFDEPAELWKLSELRYVEVGGIELLKDEEMNYSVLKKLYTISKVDVAEEATNLDGFLKSIPNIKTLVIDCENRLKSMVIDLSHLHKLEILGCGYLRYKSPDAHGIHCPFKVIFPCNIKRLYLYRCEISLEVLRSLRNALHKLEVLTIKGCTFISEEKSCEEEENTYEEELEETCEEEWELVEEDVFCSLQSLRLEELDIVHWIAYETNFPRLRHLRLHQCELLEEIPSGIGEIPTLQLIEVKYCSESVVASAERIVEEQSENGNYDLKLSIVRIL